MAFSIIFSFIFPPTPSPFFPMPAITIMQTKEAIVKLLFEEESLDLLATICKINQFGDGNSMASSVICNQRLSSSLFCSPLIFPFLPISLVSSFLLFSLSSPFFPLSHFAVFLRQNGLAENFVTRMLTARILSSGLSPATFLSIFPFFFFVSLTFFPPSFLTYNLQPSPNQRISRMSSETTA